MNARERAERIADIIWELQDGVDIQKKGVHLIENGIKEAVAQETERCCKIAEKMWGKSIADAIRGRKG